MERKKFDYSVKQYAFMNLDCIFNVPYTGMNYYDSWLIMIWVGISSNSMVLKL